MRFDRIKGLKTKIASWMLYGSRRDSDHYTNYLRNLGIAIGEGTIFFDPPSNVIDIQNPKLLRIGKNVRITHGVIILTHDYSWSVIAGKYGECLGNVAPVNIGDNVFIGMNTIILNGVNINNNVIIGAGSVVTKDCDSDSVYAGTPAKKIMELETYYNKRKARQRNEVEAIEELLKGETSSEIERYLREYIFIFSGSETDEAQALMKETGYYQVCSDFYKNHLSSMDRKAKEMIK